MAKYSYEFKKKVQAYLNSEGGYRYLAKKYGVKNKRQVLNWVHSYNKLGDDGLIRSHQNKNYSFQFKLFVVELYLSSEVSYRELALSQGINNPSLIARWVSEYDMCRDVSNIGRWGNGNVEFFFEDITEVDKAMDIIEQSFNAHMDI